MSINKVHKIKSLDRLFARAMDEMRLDYRKGTETFRRYLHKAYYQGRIDASRNQMQLIKDIIDPEE